MKNWKKVMAMGLAGVMAVGCLAGCGSSSDSSTAAGSTTAAKESDGNVKIAYIVKAKTDEFWTTMESGAYAYAEEVGVDLEFQAPEKESDVEKQVQMIENAVIKGFDAIVLSAADSTAVIPSIVKANNAGIPVILVNDTIDMDELEAQGGKVETYVGISQYDAAKQAGDYAAENIEDGKVLYLEGNPGVQALDDRLAGFKDQVDFEVVASQTAKCDRNEAYSVMQNVLNANPEVNVVWAVNAEMGQGAIQAIEQTGTDHDIAVFDFDASSDVLAAIEAGTLTGTVAQYPNKQAEGAIQACLDVLDGKTLEEHTETPSLLVTADNLADYKAEMGIE